MCIYYVHTNMCIYIYLYNVYMYIYVYIHTYVCIYVCICLCVFIHSFIHYGDLNSAPSRLLLRSAPDPCTAKEKSFEVFTLWSARMQLNSYGATGAKGLTQTTYVCMSVCMSSKPLKTPCYVML